MVPEYLTNTLAFAMRSPNRLTIFSSGGLCLLLAPLTVDDNVVALFGSRMP
jgi:hypothetical protein